MDQQTPTLKEESKSRPTLPAQEPRSRSSAKGWLWFLLLLAVAAGGYYFYSRNRGPATNVPPAAGQSRRAGGGIQVVAAKAVQGDIPVYLTGLGAVTPIYTVTVKSRVDGELMQVNYKEGEMVHKNDLLVQIDPRPYQVQLEQAQGQLMHDEALLKNAHLDLERYKTLWAQDAIPQQQLATQEALVTQDEGTVKTDQAQIDNAKLQLAYCHITSPIDGRVGLRLVDPGNIVHASDPNGLLVITQLQPITIIFTIPQDNLPTVAKRFRAGNRLEVDAFDRSNTTLLAKGALLTIDNQIDQTTATVRLRASFPNTDSSLFPNQLVNARLLVEKKQGITLLPDAAVQRNTQSTYVYLVKPDQTVTIRPITTGIQEGGRTEIVSGVAPGDVVVTDGVDKLVEGSKVGVRVQGGAPARQFTGAGKKSS